MLLVSNSCPLKLLRKLLEQKFYNVTSYPASSVSQKTRVLSMANGVGQTPFFAAAPNWLPQSRFSCDYVHLSNCFWFKRLNFRLADGCLVVILTAHTVQPRSCTTMYLYTRLLRMLITTDNMSFTCTPLVHYINLDSVTKEFFDLAYLTRPNIEGFWIQTFGISSNPHNIQQLAHRGHPHPLHSTPHRYM